MVLDSFGVCFSSFGGNTQCEQYVYDEPMTASHPFRQRLSSFRQEYPTIGTTRCQPLPLQP